jgi:hypothetical protein
MLKKIKTNKIIPKSKNNERRKDEKGVSTKGEKKSSANITIKPNNQSNHTTTPLFP